jgi:hypothetical protein
MIKAGEIIRIRPGVYGLPGAATTTPHVSARKAILPMLWAAPGHRMTRTELINTGKTTSSAIDRAVHDLRKGGLLVDGQRGVVALSPSTLRRIERGELIRTKRGDVMWAPVLDREPRDGLAMMIGIGQAHE